MLAGTPMSILLLGAGGLLLLVTVLPLVPSDERFIRVWDFPRAQIAVLLALVLIGSVIVFGMSQRAVVIWHLLLLLALCYQLYRIFPYTPLHPVEMGRADGCTRADQARLLVANVLQSNRDSAPLRRLIDETDPDVILLLETDAWWEREMRPLQETHPHVVAQPQDDSYGMLLLSRLPLIEPRVRFLLDDYVPSIISDIRLASGAQIRFHGVHPKPPPRHDTALRDAELMIVAREVRAEGQPAIVAGDLNDVAWSDTTRRFQKISGLLDPRIGRGFYNTFNANWPLLRWPVDHVFSVNSFTLVDLRRLGHIGSDHFPFFIALCHRPEAAERQPDPAADAEDERRAAETIREGRKEAGAPE